MKMSNIGEPAATLPSALLFSLATFQPGLSCRILCTSADVANYGLGVSCFSVLSFGCVTYCRCSHGYILLTWVNVLNNTNLPLILTYDKSDTLKSTRKRTWAVHHSAMTYNKNIAKHFSTIHNHTPIYISSLLSSISTERRLPIPKRRRTESLHKIHYNEQRFSNILTGQSWASEYGGRDDKGGLTVISLVREHWLWCEKGICIIYSLVNIIKVDEVGGKIDGQMDRVE